MIYFFFNSNYIVSIDSYQLIYLRVVAFDYYQLICHFPISCLPFHLASDDEFENLRIKGPNAVQLVKTTPLKLSPLPSIPDTIKEVIYDMLNALAAYHAPEEGKPQSQASQSNRLIVSVHLSSVCRLALLSL